MQRVRMSVMDVAEYCFGIGEHTHTPEHTQTHTQTMLTYYHWTQWSIYVHNAMGIVLQLYT